jgi:hypothetical protein
VHLVSFEHVLQHVELARLFSTSSEGMSATTATPFRDRLTTVQGLVANHEQGRVNLVYFPKNNGHCFFIAPQRRFLKKNISKKSAPLHSTSTGITPKMSFVPHLGASRPASILMVEKITVPLGPGKPWFNHLVQNLGVRPRFASSFRFKSRKRSETPALRFCFTA